ncbi:MAG: DUF2783 domain-containing protein [Gammaproteobacteria bacterium]|nr:DUF2783 domain-containing protein [Gammaproteobacteria bacterium]
MKTANLNTSHLNSSHLNTAPNFSDADGFYAALTDAHRELDRDQSERLNARLILLLANHIGDSTILQEALQVASELER